jgi:hypothetical protein
MSSAVGARGSAEARQAEFRYGAVFFLILVLLVFVIVAPTSDATRAIVFALQAAALMVIVATSRERRSVRNVRLEALAAVGGILVVSIALGALPASVVAGINGMLALVVLLALVRGLLRLVHWHGVTLRVVAGALTIYVLIGLVFAWVITLVSEVGAAAYFADGVNATQGQCVYYSFTVLTTTGFGDFTSATPVGHALAVVEMLLGQLYLVTIIGVLVGSFASRSRG